MTNLRCEIEKELSMVAQRAGSEEVTNGRGDNTLINWNPSLEDKFVTKTRDQPEPGSFFPRSLWGGEMKDPGNEVARMSGQDPKLGLKYWKLRVWKLTLHLINVAEINTQPN